MLFTKTEKDKINQSIMEAITASVALMNANIEQQMADRINETGEVDIKADELGQKVTALEGELASLPTSLEEKFSKLLEDKAPELFKAALADYRQKKYESDEPFIEIIGDNFASEGGVGLRLDWNTAFIKYLKSHGFTGPSDEAIVDTWVMSLSKDKPAVRDFGEKSDYK